MLVAILAIAAGLRVWAPWDDVLGTPSGTGGRINFLETDAWYHVRLAESQVRNFPHRVTTDPYAAPDGQYVAVAPLLDASIATFAFITGGRHASTEYIERVAAFAPAITGVLAVLAVWALATVAFDRRAGLIAGLLAAVLPNPRRWNASNPGPYVQGRSETLQDRAARVGTLASCLKLS